ncbi:hypothetical protein DSO57_1018162 [Entomophthora muscae]|uniref:Uncharacterized protein n=1 Tax=Entomophthora muscae TaxID=34485 RepID=A0ACC2TFC2_9FUNG|nr:hypothetical protein DSO57_1018162 [Entomophthora muscae]
MKFISTLAVVPSLALQVASSPVVSSGFESDEVMEAQFQKANHYPTTEHALKRRHYYDASSYVRSHERIPRFPNIFKSLFSFLGKGLKYAATGIKKVTKLGINAVKKDPSLLTKAAETIAGVVRLLKRNQNQLKECLLALPDLPPLMTRETQTNQLNMMNMNDVVLDTMSAETIVSLKITRWISVMYFTNK